MANARGVLVPVAVLEGEALSEALVDRLSNVEVTLLGYHELPDQTATEQAHEQFTEQVQQTLDEYVALFEAHGGTVDPRVVFTHDAPETFERIAIEEDLAAILVPNPAPAIERILVPIRGAATLEPLLRMTTALSDDAEIELFHVVASEDARGDGDQLLSTAADRLAAEDVDRDRISQQLTITETPIRAITEAAIDAGLVVIGEAEPSVADIVFGDAADRIAEGSASPVVIVRPRRSTDGD